MITGLLMLATGAVLALATWNAQRSSEMKFRGFSTIERRSSPRAFKVFVALRYVVAVLFVMVGAWSYFRV